MFPAPLIYMIGTALNVGFGIVGGLIGLVLAIMIDNGNGNGDLPGLVFVIGYALGVACGAGPVYLIAANLKRNPDYRPPQPVPGASPYGPPPGAPVYSAPAGGTNPYGVSAPQNPFAEQPAYPPPPPAVPPGGAPAAPGIPNFLPASAFAPAAQGPRRVQFYCPSGHVLEEWSTSAGEQRRCPHCGGVATVPSG